MKMFRKIIDIYKDKKEANQPLFPMGSVVYPTIEGNTSNFFTDYLTYFPHFDMYIARMWGQRNFDAFLSKTKSESESEWDDAVVASIEVHVQEWARLYYALSLKYNPIWNVDGTTVHTYGQTLKTDTYAQKTRTDNIGNTSATATNYATAYDSGLEKETGKSIMTENAKINTYTDGTHADTFVENEHTITEERTGNIGVTMTQQLLNAEYELRKRSFFRTIFKQIIDDVGCYYIEGEWI